MKRCEICGTTNGRIAGKANGQVKRKGSGYAVYVVSVVHPLIPPKKIIEDLTNDKYIENLDDCKEYMKEIMVDRECEEAGFAQCGRSNIKDNFVYSSDVVSCEECEYPE